MTLSNPNAATEVGEAQLFDGPKAEYSPDEARKIGFQRKLQYSGSEPTGNSFVYRNIAIEIWAKLPRSLSGIDRQLNHELR